MTKYTVRQIADMLHTNPETVRRWIRAGKLKSQQDSAKGENIIYKSDLDKFLNDTPKYASIVAELAIGSAIVSPLGAVASAIASGTVLAYIKGNMDNSRISKQELSTLLECAIAEKKKEISEQQEAVDAATKKLQKFKKELAELENMIPSINERGE